MQEISFCALSRHSSYGMFHFIIADNLLRREHMLAGSLSKRMVKLSRRLHKAMDGTPHVDAIAGKLDSIEKSMDDAQASIAATAAERFNAKRVGETAAASSEADSVKKAANEASSLADKKASDAKAAVSEAKKNSPKAVKKS
jgi:hypothetical protein